MADMQALLNAIIGMQQNAQAALPVIPNNGNPQGANNMPAATAPAATPMPMQSGAEKYPWLQPSPAMAAIHQMLSTPIQGSQLAAKVPSAPVTHEAIIPQRNHFFRDQRRAMREQGDFAMEAKRGEAISGVGREQELLPTMPRRPFNERY